MKQFNESVGVTDPKFTGYWKGKDADTPGKKMVGSESLNELDERPDDNFTIDDIKQLEKIDSLDLVKRKAIELITKPSKKPISPKKQVWLKNSVLGKKDKLSVIKLMYDLILSGEGMKVIGGRKSMEPNSYRKAFGEEANPTDKISMDIPLFLRMLEYAKEDAKTDMDLHQVTARAIELMQQHDYLCMDNYDTIVNNSEPIDEGWLDKVYAAGRNFADTASLGTAKYGRAGIDYAVKNVGNKLGFDVKPTTYQKELDQEVEKLDKDWKENPGASLAGMGAALGIPIAGEYGAAVKGAQGLVGQALDTYSKAVKMYPLAKAALGYKDMKNPKVEDIVYQNPNMTPDQIDKMNKTIQKTLKNRPYDADKSAKDPRAFQQRLPQGKDTAPMPEYDRDVPSMMKTAPRKPKTMVNASKEVDEEKKGLYYYVNKRKKAGTSRPASHPKAPSDQDWKNAAKTAKKESVEEFKDTAKYGDDNSSNINQEIFQLLKSGATVFSNAAGRMGQIVSANNDGVTIKTKRGKGFTSFNSGDKVKIKKVEGRPNHYHIVNVMSEGKKKGADGKACWDGYRYAGTENGKDKCVPVKKGK